MTAPPGNLREAEVGRFLSTGGCNDEDYRDRDNADRSGLCPCRRLELVPWRGKGGGRRGEDPPRYLGREKECRLVRRGPGSRLVVPRRRRTARLPDDRRRQRKTGRAEEGTLH